MTELPSLPWIVRPRECTGARRGQASADSSR